MKSTLCSILCYLALVLSSAVAADVVKTVNFGAAAVLYDLQSSGEGVATLSLNAVISETNDSLRGLKNDDQRRLSKLGQLIYQCKLLLYRDGKIAADDEVKAPMLISRNYNLFTGVDLSLAEGERLGIKVRTLQTVDAESLFTPELGGDQIQKELWQNLGEESAINLRQINVNVLMDKDVIDSAENIEIVLRFPIFQVQKSVHQWSYSFNLKDFKQAVRHADENCTPETFAEMMKKEG